MARRKRGSRRPGVGRGGSSELYLAIRQAVTDRFAIGQIVVELREDEQPKLRTAALSEYMRGTQLVMCLGSWVASRDHLPHVGLLANSSPRSTTGRGKAGSTDADDFPCGGLECG